LPAINLFNELSCLQSTGASTCQHVSWPSNKV
jgi:hypothetical protein